MTIEKENKTALKEAFDAELLKQLEENPPEIPSYEKFSSIIDGEVKKRRRRIHIISTAASIALLFLAGIATFSYFAPDIQADKNPKEEIITEDGVIIEDGGWGSSEWEDNVWMTEDWDEVEDAKSIEAKLLVPKYIPEGYAFKKLKVETVETGTTICEYVFVNNDNKSLEIEELIQRTNLQSIDISGYERVVYGKAGKIYMRNEKIAITQIDDGINVYIWGDLQDKEIIKIVNALGT